MIAAARTPHLWVKIYATALAGLGAASFVAGGWINYEYASAHPGADPYLPSPKIVIPLTPVPPAAPVLQNKVKVLPPPIETHEQAPLVSGIAPGGTVSTASGEAATTGAMTGSVMGAATGSHDRAVVRAQSGVVDCGNTPVNAAPPPTLDCHASGVIGQGVIGQMSIGAGTVKVVPTQ